MNDHSKTKEQLIKELQELRRQVAESQESEGQSRRTEEASQASALQRACFSNIADPIFVFDQETKLVLDCNQAMIDRYGYTLDELRTMTPHQLHPREELEIVERNIDDREDTSAHHYTHITKSGRRLQVEILTNGVEYDGRAAWISVIRDITQRKLAESEIVRLNNELTALNDIGQALISTLDLQETLTVITGHLIRLMGVRAASVILLDETQSELQFAAASGEGADFIRGVRIEPEQGIAGWVVQHGEPLVVPDVARDDRWLNTFDQPSGLTTRSILCVPLQVKGRTIGAVEVMNKEDGDFGDEDVQLLTSLTALAATAIETARLYDQAQKEITERRRTGQALQESEERLNTLLNSMPTGIVLIDAETHVIVDANPIAVKMIGSPREQIVGTTCHRFICPADEGNCPITDLEQIVDHSERTLLTADGEQVSILKTTVPVILDGRQHLLESFVDITERKRTEEQAERQAAQATLVYEVGRRVSGELELEALLSEIVTAIRDAFDYDGVMLLLLDEEGRNLTLQSIVGIYTDVFSDGLSLAIGEGMIGHAAATGEPQVSGDVSKDPHYVCKADEQTSSELAVPIKSGQNIIGVLDLQSKKFDVFDETDVLAMETMADLISTAIKNARLFDAVQTSEERNRLIVENASEAIFVAQGGRLQFVNPQATIITGYSNRELITRSFTGFIHPDDREMVVERHQARLKGEQNVPQSYSFRIVDKGGNTKWVELNSILIEWEDSPATLNFMADVTERMHTAEVTRQAEQRYRAVAGSAVTGIAIVDPAETLTFVNPAFADMLGYTQEELTGMSLSSLATPDEFVHYQERTQEREREGTHNHYETALLRKDGSTLNLLISGSPLTAADGSFQGTIAVVVDITERKRAVEALQEALSELEQYTYNLERQTAQLQVGAEVAREAAAILDVQQLLDTAVRLISERFGFYHAGAFLIDELREYAVLRAASSEGGRRMLARGHKLPLGKVGIVGYVAAMGQSRVALDVGQDDMHFAHGDLPNTRSEMGLPLNVRGRTIGVLDVQAPEANAFTDNDVTALQTLADQLAVAIDNARLVERTETQLRELSLLYGEYSTSAWADLTAPERSKRYVYDRIDVVPVEALESPALGMALTRGKTTSIFESETTTGAKGEKTLATPLKLHDQIIGALGIQEADGGRKWSPNEIALVEAVSDQVSLALENAQHFAETQKAAQQMQVLNELARSLAIRHTTQEVLEETYMGASLLLNTFNFFIAFYHPDDEMISFPLAVENDRSVQWQPREVGNGLTEYVIRTKQPVFVRRDLPEWLEKEGIDSIGVQSLCWLGAPLLVGERVLGVIAVQSEHNNAFDERDRNLLTGIANQTAIALQNAYLFRETENALAETEVLYSVSETISQLEGLEKTFQSLAYILTGQLEYSGAWLAQVDKRTQMLNGIAGVGLPEEWIRVKVPLDETLRDPSVQAVLTHSPVVINDVANDEQAADMNPEARSLFDRLLEVPILVGIEAGGIIAVGRSADMPEIAKRDIEVLQVVADQAAVALQNIRLLEETRRRAEQERLIYEITSKIRRSPNITTILQTAVEELGQALHTDRALVRLTVKSGETKDT